ncbi:cytochrome c biogenesis protein CcdA [Pseudodesulfovibrio sp. zrk46]|uniref:cytochrome c biogenesis CcdA family protein n=1 Tax=Pseudodesulfovibrio sp. zrk46 TaxID=2725288 RepID=UPI001448B072|nr:cytochrome c biogenesis protein CcdA [Pseudodesulfovibrio sp. zrk46]QJB55450.1 cytochrome C biosynthesis protein [Pseudodesulfovibrio sp. zrk46]
MNQLFFAVNEWLVSGTGLAALGAFSWGMISVLFSPCHLASIPLIVGYVGGQKELVRGKQAAVYASLFTLGLFLTIAAVGIVCSMLGRMLGDIGSWWTVLVGGILVWVSLDMLGVSKCGMHGNLLGKLRLKGYCGAFILGLAYGILSGSCTFGFIAPILAIITVQGEVVAGTGMILLFGIGHCLPIVVAGSSTSFVQKLMESKQWQTGGAVFRKMAGGVIGLLGLYFILQPLLDI